jgi:protein TonB
MFEHSLIDLESKPQRSRRWLSLPIAVGLHVVGLTAIAFASYWSVGEVPEPSTNVVFLSFAPLPEPPGGGGGQRPPVRPPETEVTPPAPDQPPVQPTEETIPEDVPTSPPVTSMDDVLPASGEEGLDTGDYPPCPACGIGPGFGPGPGGPGVGPGSGPGSGSEPAEMEPVHFTVGMTRPETVHQVQPKYTELARRTGVQGTVIVEAIIDEKGYVTNVRVLRGLPMGLDRAAVDAIRQWRFKPATLNSKPVKVFYTLTVNFTIQR